MTEPLSNYDHWAALYDQTLGPDYCRQKLGFLERAFLPNIPSRGRVLDLCCGTGQIIAPLIARGYAVTGLDASSDMLAYARRNAPAAEFVKGDARAFHFEAPFDGVICTSASLNHMPGLDDLRRVFECVSAALKPGGIFVFDVNHPAQLARHWRGQPAEGAIRDDHAWLITPRYEPASASGSFTVDIYRQPPGRAQAAFRRAIGNILGYRYLWRLQRQALKRFPLLQPGWEHRSTTYPVYGHDLAAIGGVLQDAGIESTCQTIDGQSELNDRHSAYFVCRKRRTDAVAANPEAPQ
jgi:SAM-dependent methyltransferase